MKDTKVVMSGIILIVSLITVVPFIFLLIESVIFEPMWSNRTHSLIGQLVENLK